MKNKELAQKIKELRNRNGVSQEELSEKSGLSLRTIQRIENGETEPRGDSLKRLAFAFNVTPDEIVDWTATKDKGFLLSFNLSALSFIFFPILGILVPLIIWISKKDKIQNLNKTASELLNFQITWTILFFLGFFGLIIFGLFGDRIIMHDANRARSLIQAFLPLIFIIFMNGYNLIFVIVNTLRINKEQHIVYFPKIKFLRL
ncbi:MAG TPA: DNA-binding protein [Bacteroidales bacterium]|nr:DNA-binding protein [Bacteroidales bacterium]